MVTRFSDISKQQQDALITWKSETTYLWPNVVGICQTTFITSTSCEIRKKNLRKIKKSLALLSKAGYFQYRYTGKLFRRTCIVYIDGITDEFKQIIKSMPTTNLTL